MKSSKLAVHKAAVLSAALSISLMVAIGAQASESQSQGAKQIESYEAQTQGYRME